MQIEHEHIFVKVYTTMAGREEVYQCQCGSGYIKNLETGQTYK